MRFWQLAAPAPNQQTRIIRRKCAGFEGTKVAADNEWQFVDGRDFLGGLFHLDSSNELREVASKCFDARVLKGNSHAVPPLCYAGGDRPTHPICHLFHHFDASVGGRVAAPVHCGSRDLPRSAPRTADLTRRGSCNVARPAKESAPFSDDTHHPSSLQWTETPQGATIQMEKSR